MKVFISWSGNLSHKIALILKDWLPNVVPSIDDAWVSSESISKGSQWSHETTKALAESDYGIICLVPENLHEPWLNFEAGAIFRAFHSSRVSPFLFGLAPKQVEGPLALFQATEYSKDDIRKLIHSINKVGLNAIASQGLNDLFDQHWPRLEQSLDLLKQSDLPAAGGRVRYLKGRKDIYANAHQLLGLAEQRVRVLQFFGGPRPPEGYAQEAAKILRSKRDCGIDVIYDAFLVIAPSRIPPDFEELIQRRFDIFAGQGVGDLIGLYLLKMEYPAGFGFDMFIVDRKHAHISFTTSERLADLQRGITFQNEEPVVSDLAEWFERSIERNASKHESLRRKAQTS